MSGEKIALNKLKTEIHQKDKNHTPYQPVTVNFADAAGTTKIWFFVCFLTGPRLQISGKSILESHSFHSNSVCQMCMYSCNH